MEPKKEYKRLAEKMRLQGLTYSEILKSLPVSKSSLSLWLHSITLSTNNKARIETLKLAGQKAGAKMRHQNRIDQQNTLIATTQKEISKLIKDPFFTFGLSLYWAEGSKQKPWRLSGNVGFTNSDPQTILIMRMWLHKYSQITEDNTIYRLCIHKSADIKKATKEWAFILGVDEQKILLSIKNHETKNGRHPNQEYRGLVHMRIRKSTWLNRKIALWSEFTAKNFLVNT